MGSNPVFPTILKHYYFSYLLSMLNINKLHKNLSFNIIFNKKNLRIVIFLKKLNLIYKYTLINKKNIIFIKINLYFYKNKSPASFFKIVSKPSKKFFISYKSLRLLTKKTGNSIFLVSTPKGILTHKDAIKLKTSGFIVCFFSY